MVSPSVQSGAAEAAPLPSWQHLVGAPNSLRQQAETGCVPKDSAPGHTDSWGIGWFDANGLVSLVRQTGSASESGYFVMTAEAASRGGGGSGPARTLIGHLRKASMGAVTSENAHPVRADFHRAGRTDTLLVAHNGTIRTPLLSTLRSDLTESRRQDAMHSDNDTVVLAAWLAERADGSANAFASLASSLQVLLERAESIASTDFDGDLTQCYTALNLVIAHAEGLFVLRQFSRESEYYTLYRREMADQESTTGGYIVASERTDEIATWDILEPGVLTFLPAQSGKTIEQIPVRVSGRYNR